MKIKFNALLGVTLGLILLSSINLLAQPPGDPPCSPLNYPYGSWTLGGPSGYQTGHFVNFTADASATCMADVTFTVTVTASSSNPYVIAGPSVNGTMLPAGASVSFNYSNSAPLQLQTSVPFTIAFYRAIGSTFTVTITAINSSHTIGSPNSTTIYF
jgi:hypothetical protein